MIERRPLVEPDVCRAAAQAVRDLDSHWIDRAPAPCGFHTLGVNCYQDLVGTSDPEATYFGPARGGNALLWEHFSPILEAIRACVEVRVAAPATFPPDLALPGFHIFRHDAIPRKRATGPHFDLQYLGLAGTNPAIPSSATDEAEVLSFTLPIQLPVGGGGLYVWDVTLQELNVLAEQGVHPSVKELRATRKRTRHRYRLGELTLHAGHELHAIAPTTEVAPDDARITVQGHGIRVGDEWWLYW